MQRETTVWIREPCDECAGSGQQTATRQAAHSQWSTKVECPACSGAGYAERWAGLAELRSLIDRSS